MRVFGFVRGKIELYMPIECIRGIYPEEMVFSYPELYDRFLGLVFINGEVIPVVDVDSLFCKEQIISRQPSPSRRCSLVLAESVNSPLAFVYDNIKDIYERSDLGGLRELESVDIEKTGGGAFFVENIKLLEDIITRIRVSSNCFKEIFTCRKES